jgi:uncharacterized protein (TIGR02996 family)
MNGDEGLFRAMLESPQDETLRQVLADWHEEHGDGDRAEFIRLQCRLAPLLNDLSAYAQGLDPWTREARLPLWRRLLDQPVAPPAPRADLLREAELLQRRRRSWNGVIHRRLAGTPLAGAVRSRGGPVRGWAYRRGFVEALACTPETWGDHSALLRTLGPLRCLRLHPETFDGIIRLWPRLDFSGLDVVSLEGVAINAPAFQALLAWEGVRSLPVLDLRGCQIGYSPAVNAWLQARGAEQAPRVVYRLPNPPEGHPPVPYYPPPFLPKTEAPWLKVWLNLCRQG